MPTVQIGEDPVSLQEYSSFKALRAMALVKEVLEAYPEILKEIHSFVREYEAENKTEMDRSTALFQFGAERLGHLTDADWEKSGNKLMLPRSPSIDEQLIAVFPTAFDKAREQTLKLCALALLTNRELEEADLEGGDPAVDALIAEKSKRLVHQAKFDQLLELLVVSLEIAQDQIGTKLDGLKERLGNALRLFGLTLPGSLSGDSTVEEETPSTDPSTDQEASPTSPPSSTSSPEPTAGTESPASTEPAGTSRSSSALA